MADSLINTSNSVESAEHPLESVEGVTTKIESKDVSLAKGLGGMLFGAHVGIAGKAGVFNTVGSAMGSAGESIMGAATAGITESTTEAAVTTVATSAAEMVTTEAGKTIIQQGAETLLQGILGLTGLSLKGILGIATSIDPTIWAAMAVGGILSSGVVSKVVDMVRTRVESRRNSESSESQNPQDNLDLAGAAA